MLFFIHLKNDGELPQYRIYNNHPEIIPKATWEYVQEYMPLYLKTIYFL